MKKVIFLVLVLQNLLFSAYLIQSKDSTYLTCDVRYSGTVVSSGGFTYLGQYGGNDGLINAIFSKGTGEGWNYRSCSVYNNGCVSPNYFSYKNTQTCVNPNSCTSPEVWNSATDTCFTPAPDADGDGTPDKCDFDHPDFKILDCDGDDRMNSGDPDLDGDGTDDTNDADMNNDGIPDAQQPASPNYNPNCQGADLSRDYVITGITYPETNYYLKGNMFITQCIALVDYNNIDSSFSAFDKNPQCNATYCFVHLFKPDCNDESAKYIPQGSGWIYKSGVSSSSQCSAMVDNIKYSQSTFEAPNLTTCPDSKYCFLKRVENVPDINNSISEPIDTNRTSLDLQPLLEAHNKTNEHLTDIKTKIETTNTKLDDLKGVSNEILNKNESMNSSLKSLKSNSDISLKNDLESLSTLGNIANAAQKGNDINKAFSDVSTKNQMIGNEHLSSIDGKMNTNNALLTTIDATATESKDFLSSMKNFLDGKNSDGTSSDISSLTSSFASGDDLLGRVTGSFTNVASSFASSTSLINQGFSYSPPSGSNSPISFNALGRSISLDLCTSLSTISGIFYYIFYVLFMVVSLRIFYQGIKVR